ncbi:snurportin-1-like [Bolinopsis microptera]|uniref:snurportin-1-like n=1 Tax=Bolinopsis microptera TaxID=2820187 RepID=UPI00307934A9
MGDNFEELVSDLSSFSVSNEENCAVSRIDLYKTKTSKQDQETRRAKFLERQKSDRQSSLSALRNIEEESQSPEKTNPYKNQLMLSEWLQDKPDDFEENWLCKFAPVGHRTLIVAHKGRTESYTKNGYRTASFPSMLPGGSNATRSSYSLLDAVWCDTNHTFYILDLICYRAHPVDNSEAEFRFYWGATKFSEDLPGISSEQRTNRYPMVWLPSVPCAKENLMKMMAEKQEFEVDGFLFYHKMGHYAAGPTPLVGWLKPDLLNKVLDLDLDLTSYQMDS